MGSLVVVRDISWVLIFTSSKRKFVGTTVVLGGSAEAALVFCGVISLSGNLPAVSASLLVR